MWNPSLPTPASSLGQMDKPDVDSIEGLSPAISIEQKTTSKNPRSTVGTVTEIYDYPRLLFARIGVPHCPEHGIRIESLSPERIADSIAGAAGPDEDGGLAVEGAGEEGTGPVGRAAGRQVTILAPVVRARKGTYAQLFSDLNAEGYSRVCGERPDQEERRGDRP